MSEWIAMKWQRRDDFDGHELTPVTVERMDSPFYSGERYAIRWHGRCLNRRGKWEIEPIPSSRDHDFYIRCRFLLCDEAFKYAEAAILEIRRSGL